MVENKCARVLNKILNKIFVLQYPSLYMFNCYEPVIYAET